MKTLMCSDVGKYNITTRKALKAVIISVITGIVVACATTPHTVYTLKSVEPEACPPNVVCKVCAPGQFCGWYHPEEEPFANTVGSYAEYAQCRDAVPNEIIQKTAGETYTYTVPAQQVRVPTLTCDPTRNPLGCGISSGISLGQSASRKRQITEKVCDQSCKAARKKRDELIIDCMNTKGWRQMRGFN